MYFVFCMNGCCMHGNQKQKKTKKVGTLRQAHKNKKVFFSSRRHSLFGVRSHKLTSLLLLLCPG